MNSSLILAILLLAIVLHGVQSMPGRSVLERSDRHPGSKTGPDSGSDGDDTTRSADESKPKRKQGGWNIKRGGWSRPKRSSLMTNKRSNKVPNTRKSPK